ncbi:surface-adhesin E family protein [Burkholderia sp. NLJ2]|uniref:surface-adhesin E family protein n=1 Tax=Burkholderia sp. NLJ2 TaxID=3090699 RepID=UPI003C6CBCF0
MLVVALITASTGVAAGPAWVAVAASPDMRILVDAGSVTKNSRGVIDLWTKTRYASPQTATGIQYAADMTRFALDCAAARYGITGGKFLDAQGKVLRQFDEPAAELEPIPVASKIDAVARAVCPMGRGTWRGK